eukprot:CAMPEP_0114991868 /NCGR_PEP_ID=MMETSP0216-20121206/11617_1 /TAXON_ID=223996 /ORGANISM="Protocruzia adherens, Strain Boccale" /LENGTH=260 /DNA_ID=CAMNT_0002355255 /DNA_START=49 /DNA_END=831 /DNA_ORIENTATION=-
MAGNIRSMDFPSKASWNLGRRVTKYDLSSFDETAWGKVVPKNQLSVVATHLEGLRTPLNRAEHLQMVTNWAVFPSILLSLWIASQMFPLPAAPLAVLTVVTWICSSYIQHKNLNKVRQSYDHKCCEDLAKICWDKFSAKQVNISHFSSSESGQGCFRSKRRNSFVRLHLPNEIESERTNPSAVDIDVSNNEIEVINTSRMNFTFTLEDASKPSSSSSQYNIIITDLESGRQSESINDETLEESKLSDGNQDSDQNIVEIS